MKRVLIVFLLSIILIGSYVNILKAQEPYYLAISFGGSFNTLPSKTSSNMSLEMSAILLGLYLDASSNLARGEGSPLDYSSNQTYSTDKVAISSFNIGYTIPVSKKKSLYLTPFAGLIITYDIYEDFVTPVTHYRVKDKTFFNAGGLLMINMGEMFHFQFGTSLKQYVKFGIGIGFK